MEVEEVEVSEESVPMRGGAEKPCCGRVSTSVREEVDVFAVAVAAERGVDEVFMLAGCVISSVDIRL